MLLGLFISGYYLAQSRERLASDFLMSPLALALRTDDHTDRGQRLGYRAIIQKDFPDFALPSDTY